MEMEAIRRNNFYPLVLRYVEENRLANVRTAWLEMIATNRFPLGTQQWAERYAILFDEGLSFYIGAHAKENGTVVNWLRLLGSNRGHAVDSLAHYVTWVFSGIMARSSRRSDEGGDSDGVVEQYIRWTMPIIQRGQKDHLFAFDTRFIVESYLQQQQHQPVVNRDILKALLRQTKKVNRENEHISIALVYALEADESSELVRCLFDVLAGKGMIAECFDDDELKVIGDLASVDLILDLCLRVCAIDTDRLAEIAPALLEPILGEDNIQKLNKLSGLVSACVWGKTIPSLVAACIQNERKSFECFDQLARYITPNGLYTTFGKVSPWLTPKWIEKILSLKILNRQVLTGACMNGLSHQVAVNYSLYCLEELDLIHRYARETQEGFTLSKEDGQRLALSPEIVTYLTAEWPDCLSSETVFEMINAVHRRAVPEDKEMASRVREDMHRSRCELQNYLSKGSYNVYNKYRMRVSEYE